MKKPSLAVLIGVGKPHGDAGSDEGSDNEDQAYADAGDHLLAAFKKGDGRAVADAVCALFDLHAASKDDHEEEDEESYDSKE